MYCSSIAMFHWSSLHILSIIYSNIALIIVTNGYIFYIRESIIYPNIAFINCYNWIHFLFSWNFLQQYASIKLTLYSTISLNYFVTTVQYWLPNKHYKLWLTYLATIFRWHFKGCDIVNWILLFSLLVLVRLVNFQFQNVINDFYKNIKDHST